MSLRSLGHEGEAGHSRKPARHRAVPREPVCRTSGAQPAAASGPAQAQRGLQLLPSGSSKSTRGVKCVSSGLAFTATM